MGEQSSLWMLGYREKMQNVSLVKILKIKEEKFDRRSNFFSKKTHIVAQNYFWLLFSGELLDLKWVSQFFRHLLIEKKLNSWCIHWGIC